MEQNYIWIKEDSFLHKVEIESILFACAKDRGCEIFTTKTAFKLNCSLARLIEQSPPGLFTQVHKSVIVNLEHVSVMSREMMVISTYKLPIARGYASELLKKFTFLA